MTFKEKCQAFWQEYESLALMTVASLLLLGDVLAKIAMAVHH